MKFEARGKGGKYLLIEDCLDQAVLTIKKAEPDEFLAEIVVYKDDIKRIAKTW